MHDNEKSKCLVHLLKNAQSLASRADELFSDAIASVRAGTMCGDSDALRFALFDTLTDLATSQRRCADAIAQCREGGRHDV